MQKVRLTSSKPSRENDSTLIFKHLPEVLNLLRNINCIHNIFIFSLPPPYSLPTYGIAYRYLTVTLRF